MSVEITLFTKKATKTRLCKFLLDSGFTKTRHFFEQMNSAEMLHFIWFGFDNYESSTGVEATVLKSTDKDKEKYNCSIVPSLNWLAET